MARAHALLFAVAFAALPARASAQPAEAKPLAEAGIELYHEGRTAEALEKLLQAEAAYSAPVHQVYIARAHTKLGHLVEARRHYERVLADRPRPGENAALASIREAARRELDALGERVPLLSVTIAGSEGRRVRAHVDGRAVKVSDLERGVPLDPGEHTVEVSVAPGAARRHRVVLGEGRRERLAIVLDPVEATADPVDAAPPPSGDAEVASGPEAAGPSRVPAAIAFGVGALGLGVGAVTGIMTLSAASDIEARCRDGHCPPDEAPNGERAETLAAVSTVSFVAGALGIATGIVLLSLESPRSSAATAVRVVVGPASVTASTRF